MKRRHRIYALFVLSSAVVLHATCAQVAGQVSRRGYSSRGVGSVRSRGSNMGRTARPTYGQSTYGANVNPAGPLNLGYVPNSSGTVLYFDSSSWLPPGDSSALGNFNTQTDLSSPDGGASATSRPTIRPRLDISGRDALNSSGTLRNIRDAVLEQVARCPERPFTAPWYTAHGSVAPTRTTTGNPWSSGSWTELSEWIGLDAEPHRYDFRPDKRGLIFVYQDDTRRERAVDARAPALQLANAAQPTDDQSEGISLGVFAAVPPIDEPVSSLLHLVTHASGAVSGYRYEFSSDSVQPLRGAIDASSQRVAWQMGADVAEAGLKNLTDDVARSLLFRADGWTQAWILIRIPELAPLDQASEGVR